MSDRYGFYTVTPTGNNRFEVSYENANLDNRLTGTSIIDVHIHADNGEVVIEAKRRPESKISGYCAIVELLNTPNGRPSSLYSKYRIDIPSDATIRIETEDNTYLCSGSIIRSSMYGTNTGPGAGCATVPWLKDFEPDRNLRRHNGAKSTDHTKLRHVTFDFLAQDNGETSCLQEAYRTALQRAKAVGV